MFCTQGNGNVWNVNRKPKWNYQMPIWNDICKQRLWKVSASLNFEWLYLSQPETLQIFCLWHQRDGLTKFFQVNLTHIHSSGEACNLEQQSRRYWIGTWVNLWCFEWESMERDIGLRNSGIFSSRTVQQKTFWLRRCYFFQWETEFPSRYSSNSGKWVCPTMIVSSTRARVIFPPSQNCTYFKENQTWTDSKICMFQMTSRRLGFYSNKAPSTRMAPEEISVIRSKALKRPWLRQQLALWLWVKLLVIVSWVICIYIYMYHSQEQIQRLQWCTQLILVMVSVVYAPYEHQSVDADTTNGSLKNDKTHVPFHVTTRLD